MGFCKNCYTSRAALNSHYCEQCKHEISASNLVDFELKKAGKGVKYEDKNGVVHACEGSSISDIEPDISIYWTTCKKMDVPANQGFKGDGEISCLSCISKIAGKAEEEFYSTT